MFATADARPIVFGASVALQGAPVTVMAGRRKCFPKRGARPICPACSHRASLPSTGYLPSTRPTRLFLGSPSRTSAARLDRLALRGDGLTSRRRGQDVARLRRRRLRCRRGFWWGLLPVRGLRHLGLRRSRREGKERLRQILTGCRRPEHPLGRRRVRRWSRRDMGLRWLGRLRRLRGLRRGSGLRLRHRLISFSVLASPSRPGRSSASR